ncbi:MAG: iron-containing alcohol dehydrogenase [Microvirga sp.]
MQLRGNWNYPTAIRFGAGRIAELPEAVRSAGIERPLLVTDPRLAGMAMTMSALDLLRAAGLSCAVFSEVRPNPVAANVEAGVKVLREGRHDGVVAFGGGSALDVGKVVAFMAGQTRPMWDFEDVGDWWTRADPAGIAPIVAVPTTAGTGSEVGRAGVVTDEATHTKKIIFHPLMMPRVTICDPELTVGMPPAITAGTGMDAFAHCLEAYCAPAYHPLADGIAVEGMRLVKENLARAVADGSDIEARAHMMAAAAMGATAFQKGLGAIHALSHPVGSLYDTHHGMTNAVFMPYVLAFNRPAVEDRIARLAAYLGLAASFDAFLDFVLALRRDIGVPHTLDGLGVDDDKAETVAVMAPDDPTAGSNPVALTRTSALRIFSDAMEGRL